VLDAARQAAAARIVKVRRDINDYLEYDELV
jgi:hypothetical protein